MGYLQSGTTTIENFWPSYSMYLQGSKNSIETSHVNLDRSPPELPLTLSLSFSCLLCHVSLTVSPFGPVCLRRRYKAASSADPSIVYSFASRTLGQIRVRFTKFSWQVKNKHTGILSVCVCVCVCLRNSSEKSILLPRLPSQLFQLFVFIFSKYTHDCLLRFSGFSLCVFALTLLRLALPPSLSRSLKSPVDALECFISDRAPSFSFSNKTFRYFRWLAQLSFVRLRQRISSHNNNNNKNNNNYKIFNNFILIEK